MLLLPLLLLLRVGILLKGVLKLIGIAIHWPKTLKSTLLLLPSGRLELVLCWHKGSKVNLRILLLLIASRWHESRLKWFLCVLVLRVLCSLRLKCVESVRRSQGLELNLVLSWEVERVCGLELVIATECVELCLRCACV